MVPNETQEPVKTADGLPAREDMPIELPGHMDPTNEEAQRALAAINGNTDPGPAAKVEDAKVERKPIPVFDDPRNDITKNFRTNRGQVNKDDIEGEVLVDPRDKAVMYGTDIAGDDAAIKAQETAQLEKKAEPTRYKVKIDGVEKDVTHEELVASYQKNGTGDARLNEATRRLNEATARAEQLSTKANSSVDPQGDKTQPTSEPATTSTPRGAKVDRKALADAVEKIQLGTTEEGVDALVKAFESVAPQHDSPDIDAQVDTAIAAREIRKTSEEATSKFIVKHPELKENTILQSVLGDLVTREMAADFVNLGMDAETLGQVMPTRKHIKHYYDAMRLKNPEFGRDLSTLYGVAEKDRNFQRLAGYQPAPVEVNLDRTERKEGVQPQPALRTSVPLQQTQQEQAVPREKRMSTVVQQMQRDRGQNVSA